MHVGEWLGFIINTIQITFQVLQRKPDKLHNQINALILSTAMAVKGLARVAGQIVSYDAMIRVDCQALYSSDIFSNRTQLTLASMYQHRRSFCR